jgi:hypothetical protein
LVGSCTGYQPRIFDHWNDDEPRQIDGMLTMHVGNQQHLSLAAISSPHLLFSVLTPLWYGREAAADPMHVLHGIFTGTGFRGAGVISRQVTRNGRKQFAQAELRIVQTIVGLEL